MKDSKLLQFNFLWQILAYEAVNLTTLHLTCYIKSFYINILLKQNKIGIL